jgi:ferrous iron transport protein B
VQEILERADAWHRRFGHTVHDQVTASTFSAAARIAERALERGRPRGQGFNAAVDKVLTSRLVGVPVMVVLLAVVFWITIVGANYPSAALSALLMEEWGLYGLLHRGFAAASAPWWLTGFLVDGVYLGLAWVVAVMLPPMAIFFPLFTLLEDLGFLPRIAFNLDRFFRVAGSQGRQALTMAMGFGCNAAGVTACRIIDSPRDRIIAILTNTFVPCNGRWPTLIMIASLFVAAAFPPMLATVVSVGVVTGATLVGILFTLIVSLVLSRTLLRGKPSSFILEMPPFRRPQLGRILYRSLIDRTFFVLRRAIICAAPAGGLIWLLSAVPVGNGTLFQFLAGAVEPAARVIGLDGVILIAFIFAIPANEIVIPTIIMGYMNLTRMTELGDPSALFADNGWTLITAVCVILFSLLHYPCTTTTMTVWAETRSVKWTVLSNVIPLAVALAVCFAVAQAARLLAT